MHGEPDKGWTHINRIRGKHGDGVNHEADGGQRSTTAPQENTRLTQTSLRDYISKSITTMAATESTRHEEGSQSLSNVQSKAIAELRRLKVELAAQKVLIKRAAQAINPLLSLHSHQGHRDRLQCGTMRLHPHHPPAQNMAAEFKQIPFFPTLSSPNPQHKRL